MVRGLSIYQEESDQLTGELTVKMNRFPLNSGRFEIPVRDNKMPKSGGRSAFLSWPHAWHVIYFGYSTALVAVLADKMKFCSVLTSVAPAAHIQQVKPCSSSQGRSSGFLHALPVTSLLSVWVVPYWFSSTGSDWWIVAEHDREPIVHDFLVMWLQI